LSDLLQREKEIPHSFGVINHFEWMKKNVVTLLLGILIVHSFLSKVDECNATYYHRGGVINYLLLKTAEVVARFFLSDELKE
jgi:hypothetical protein